MKTLKIVALLTLFSFSLMAHEATNERRYINLDQLVLDESRMTYFDLDHELLITFNTLEKDDRGYYYSIRECNWECPRCRADNPGDYEGQSCRRCGWPVWD